jgi:hypothetical protein
VTYVLEEYCVAHQTAEDFGRELATRFGSSQRRIVAWYLSPDSWNKRGDGHTIADQMTAAAMAGFEAASNDRIGGAMLLYERLDSGDLVICDGCTQLIAAIPTRIHDPARPDDILKITGDPLDDCIDAFRYGIYSYIGPARVPVEVRAAQAVTSQDPTIAAMQRRVFEAKQQAVSARYLAGRHGRG